MVGRTYLERGKPVVIVVRWGTGGGPRNVAIRRDDGELVVRPFRGLRRVLELALTEGSLNPRAPPTRPLLAVAMP